ncbi:MAG: sodium:solute symporter family transporter [Dehalobacterium sp.]|jgi:sodium/pantothenate symporter
MTQGIVIFAWIVLALFIGLFLWIGSRGKKSANSMKGFAIAKGAVKPWMLGVCFGATYASANLFIGVPGWAYSYGETILWWTWGCFGLSWIAIILLCKKFWQFGQQAGGSITVAEWFAVRYKSPYLRVGVALLSILSIFYIAGQTVGMAIIFEQILQLPYVWGAIIGTIIVMIYIGMGGAYADIVTDAIQGIIMMVFGVIVLISVALSIGGGLGFIGKLHGQLNAISPDLTAHINPANPNFGDIFGLVGIEVLLIGFVLLPQLINKVLALNDEGEMREFLFSSGISLLVMSNTMVFAGLAARVLIPGLEAADSAVPQYLLYAFPPVVAVLITIAILAAVLSTTDGLYVSISSTIANDIFRKTLAPKLYGNSPEAQEKAEKTALIIAKVLVPIIGLAAIAIAMTRPSSLTLLTQIGNSGIISGVAAPLVLGYFWSKANGKAAFASFLAGAGLYTVLLVFKIEPNVFKALIYASSTGFITMIIVGLLTKPDPEEHVRRFIPKYRAK